MARGMNGVLNAIVGDWQTSGVATFKGGFPLTITRVATLIHSAWARHVNVVGDYHVSSRPHRMV